MVLKQTKYIINKKYTKSAHLYKFPTGVINVSYSWLSEMINCNLNVCTLHALLAYKNIRLTCVYKEKKSNQYCSTGRIWFCTNMSFSYVLIGFCRLYNVDHSWFLPASTCLPCSPSDLILLQVPTGRTHCAAVTCVVTVVCVKCQHWICYLYHIRCHRQQL